MRVIRYRQEDEKPRYGWVFEDKVGEIEGAIFGQFKRAEAEIPIESVEIIAPVEPSKIVCVGRNYAAHAEEHGAEVPDLPLLFLKPPSAIIASGKTIILPPQSKTVEHEAELAIVIGKRGKWIQTEEVSDHIFGYTIANDVSARDLQRRDGQWTRAKGFDTFCPIGPWIETEFDATDALITCYVNEEMRQIASTRDMVFPVSQLIVFISSVMTLEPGDVILTGTPAGVGPLEDGDEVVISIEEIGELKNSVEQGKSG